jgi:hypothetical protein
MKMNSELYMSPKTVTSGKVGCFGSWTFSDNTHGGVRRPYLLQRVRAVRRPLFNGGIYPCKDESGTDPGPFMHRMLQVQGILSFPCYRPPMDHACLIGGKRTCSDGPGYPFPPHCPMRVNHRTWQLTSFIIFWKDLLRLITTVVCREGGRYAYVI